MKSIIYSDRSVSSQGDDGTGSSIATFQVIMIGKYYN